MCVAAWLDAVVPLYSAVSHLTEPHRNLIRGLYIASDLSLGKHRAIRVIRVISGVCMHVCRYICVMFVLYMYIQMHQVNARLS